MALLCPSRATKRRYRRCCPCVSNFAKVSQWRSSRELQWTLFGLVCAHQRLCQLLDDVLIGLKRGNSSPNDERRKELAGLLSGTPATPRDNLSAQIFQIFQIFLQTETALDRGQMREVGTALLSANPPSALIERLEAGRCGHIGKNARPRLMDEYFRGAIPQLVERARVLSSRIPRDLPRDYDTLAHLCRSRINMQIEHLRELLNDPLFAAPAYYPERLRLFKRNRSRNGYS